VAYECLYIQLASYLGWMKCSLVLIDGNRSKQTLHNVFRKAAKFE